jgi:hypothetical protein
MLRAAVIRIAAVILACGVLSGPLEAAAQDTVAAAKPVPVLNDDQLFHKYVVSTVGPSGLIGAAAAAGWEQYQNYPDEWGRGTSGYAKRWASAYAAGAIGNTTKYAFAHALHQDPSFTPCRCRGFNARMRHAVTSVFTARTRSGRDVFSPATVAGLAAEHMIPAALWFPRDKLWQEGVGLAAVGIATKIGVNIFHEFAGHPKIVFVKD